MEERDRWIRALERSIQRHSNFYRARGKKWSAPAPDPNTGLLPTGSLREFEKRIAEADGYLQILIQQV